jgi:hypothetical protein
MALLCLYDTKVIFQMTAQEKQGELTGAGGN